MAEPLAAAVHAVRRASGNDATDVGVVGGGPMGLMLAWLLIGQGRDVTSPTRMRSGAPRPTELGATPAEHLTQPRARVRGRRPPRGVACGGRGGRTRRRRRARRRVPDGTEVSFQTGPLHYEELELRGSFHHSPDDVDEALTALAADETLWRTLRGPTISLEELPDALGAPTGARLRRRWSILGLPHPRPELEVLDDPARVADRLALDHEHRHPPLTGQRLDLGPP